MPGRETYASNWMNRTTRPIHNAHWALRYDCSVQPDGVTASSYCHTVPRTDEDMRERLCWEDYARDPTTIPCLCVYEGIAGEDQHVAFRRKRLSTALQASMTTYHAVLETEPAEPNYIFLLDELLVARLAILLPLMAPLNLSSPSSAFNNSLVQQHLIDYSHTHRSPLNDFYTLIGRDLTLGEAMQTNRLCTLYELCVYLARLVYDTTMAELLAMVVSYTEVKSRQHPPRFLADHIQKLLQKSTQPYVLPDRLCLYTKEDTVWVNILGKHPLYYFFWTLSE
jgi:hypothetical protein